MLLPRLSVTLLPVSTEAAPVSKLLWSDRARSVFGGEKEEGARESILLGAPLEE